jgi:phenylpropionate dioxygenase-like ring-hydroxylating dioxygenase large terminal subunit
MCVCLYVFAVVVFLETCSCFTAMSPSSMAVHGLLQPAWLHAVGRPARAAISLVTQPRMQADTRAGSNLQSIAQVDSSVTPKLRFADFSWSKQWYPMAFSSVTDRTIPHRLELFGEPMVLWWDPTRERWCAMSDSCPHRAAPLSEGRVDESGFIECPYHGWTFDGNAGGACTKIPQAADGGDKTMLSRCGGRAYAVEEKQGIVWVWGEVGGVPDPAAIPVCEALDDERFCWIDVSRDMPYSADMLLENVLDSSHVPFTHHQTISRRENAVPLPLRLTSALSPAGFSGEMPTLSSADTQGGPSSNSSAPDWQGKATERTSVFRAPAYMHHRIRSADKKVLL